MTETGFYAQPRNSPGSLALVILLHAAVLAAVIMIKGPQFIRDHIPPIIVESYPIAQDPPPEPQPRPQPEQRSQIAQPERIIRTDQTNQTVTTTHDPPPQNQFADNGGETVVPPRQPDPPLPPVRRGAELDPRYAGELQPPYPASEHRAQREGRVQVRVTIAPSGRVSAIVRLMATSEAFWLVTERQALAHWRFRPATVDGRPIADSKVMTLQFRLVDQ